MLEIIIINTLLLPEHSLLLILLIELCTNKYIVKAKKYIYRESEFIGSCFFKAPNRLGLVFFLFVVVTFLGLEVHPKIEQINYVQYLLSYIS